MADVRRRSITSVDRCARELAASIRNYADAISEAERAIARFTDASRRVPHAEQRMLAAVQGFEGLLPNLRSRHAALNAAVVPPTATRRIRIRQEEP